MAYEKPSVNVIQSSSLLASSAGMVSDGGTTVDETPAPSTEESTRLISPDSISVTSGFETSGELEPCTLYGVVGVKMPRERVTNATLSGQERYYVSVSDASALYDNVTGNPMARIVCSQIQIKLASDNASLNAEVYEEMNDTYSSTPLETPSFFEALAEAVVEELFVDAAQELSTIANVAITAASIYQRFQDIGWQGADAGDGKGKVEAKTVEMRTFKYASSTSQSQEINWFSILVDKGQSCYFTIDYLVCTNDSAFFVHLTKKYKLSGGNLYEIAS